MAALPHYVHPHILNQVQGSFGISYNIFTAPTERDLPQGWYSYQRQTYRRLIRHLDMHGFHHHQYSDRRWDNTNALAVYLVMVQLHLCLPPSKFATTVKSIKMHHFTDLNVFDQTHELILGGFYSPQLVGYVPQGLVPAGVVLNPPAVPANPGGFQRPVDT
ncbi:unnamed protein product [Cyclocybe aegerita]|uniref:Uncharacterized protein n=1 Tax=Cyclocybe aegerita TaxID=1973307 RepID=A0A8S0WK70_CYCAE|nr:unnamed protein product [Cyclocybe aegerita]